MAEQCVSCELELNNDIMGIGVRAALYSQIILAWIMSLIYPNTFVKNSRSAYMTATALLVASLIEWKTQTLSLLDALVVSLMSSMMTIFIVVSGTSREKVQPAPGQPSRTTSTNPSTTPIETDTPPDSTQPSSTPPPVQQHNTSQYPGTTSTSTQFTGSPVAIPQPAHIPPSSVQLQTTEQQATAQASDPAKPGYKPRRSNTQWFIRFCFVNIWGGWCFNLWNDPAHFGLDGLKANCTTNSDITVWVFGVEVKAIAPGIRIAALVLVSVLYFIATCSLFFTLEDILDPAFRMFRLIGGLLAAISPQAGSTTTTHRSLHEDPAINSIRYLLHISAFGTLIYLIVSTEMTVRNNDKEREMMEWSYGQVIALILLLQQFMDICSTYIEGREERQAKKEKAEREAQVDPEQQESISMNAFPSTPNAAHVKQ
ncbi:unnamed protein product [Rhizoctonia solani]|uniref:Transmembrane protein n=1 Tax=Rhizoctonia solani TaxID=456999 RepID=A0A8H2X278_9AGAM|nr:unnamed protein product [Rhizoctonia solani]